jgi:hypothetical protein
VASVTVGLSGHDGLLVELREKNMGDGVVDGLGGVLEEVGESDVEAAFAEPDCGVERGETAEADVEGRDGRTGTEVAVLVFEDGDERGRSAEPGGVGSRRAGLALRGEQLVGSGAY